MEMRPYGRTGMQVSVLGFGCGAVGGLMVRGDPRDQQRAIARALDAGVNYFDTAVAYGNGESEKNLGRILQELKPPNAVVGTKVRLPSATFTRIAETITASLDAIKTVQSKWQIEELAAVQQLRVSHAINAPRTAAKLILPAKPADRVTRPLVKKDETAADLIKADSAQGALVSLLQGKVALDLEQIDAFEIVVRAAGTGGKALDDKSRSRSLLARRSDAGRKFWGTRARAATCRRGTCSDFKVLDDGQVEFEGETVTLLRVDNLPDPRAISPDDYFQLADGGLTEINLARFHAAGILKEAVQISVGTAAPCPTKEMRTIVANTPVVFEDARARKLAVKVVAVSRFSSLFESAPLYAERDLLKRRQALASGHQNSPSTEQEIWIQRPSGRQNVTRAHRRRSSSWSVTPCRFARS